MTAGFAFAKYVVAGFSPRSCAPDVQSGGPGRAEARDYMLKRETDGSQTAAAVRGTCRSMRLASGSSVDRSRRVRLRVSRFATPLQSFKWNAESSRGDAQTVDPKLDALPELPGMGWFNHAIVYAPGTPDIWIDATCEFGRAGRLPDAAQGHMALIARPESDGLIRTPESAPSDNTSIQTREFFLPEIGRARVVETTELSGALEQELRSSYAGLDAAGLRSHLEEDRGGIALIVSGVGNGTSSRRGHHY